MHLGDAGSCYIIIGYVVVVHICCWWYDHCRLHTCVCRLDVTNMVRAEAGVDLKVMGPQEVPACALSNDRVLQ